METAANATRHEPWNKSKIVGQKAPFKAKDIWALRARLQMEKRLRELALLDLGIGSLAVRRDECRTPPSHVQRASTAMTNRGRLSDTWTKPRYRPGAVTGLNLFDGQ